MYNSFSSYIILCMYVCVYNAIFLSKYCLHEKCSLAGVNGTNAPINRDQVHKWTLFEMLLSPGITVCISFFPSYLVYRNRTQWGGNRKRKISSK